MAPGGSGRRRGRKKTRTAHKSGGRFFAEGSRGRRDLRRSNAEWKETQAQEDRDAQAKEAPAQESTQEEEQVGRTADGAQWGERVVAHLEAAPSRSFKIKDLARALKIHPSRYRAFRAVVLGTARQGRIATLPRRRFQALGGSSLLEGEVTGIGQRASHVRLADGTTLPLSPYSLDMVIPGDRARVRRVRLRGDAVAQVQHVVQTAPRHVMGLLERVKGRWVLVPDQPIPGVTGGLFIEDDSLPADAEAQLARAMVPSFRPATERPTLPRVEVLGDAEHPRVAIQRLLVEQGWPEHFSEAAQREAQVDPVALARRDLTEPLVFTIDPVDAKDHDDAVSIQRQPDGGFVLGVHIADVASRVQLDGDLEAEALARTTSVYPPGMVSPMLPELLSGGECSLHHGVVRHTLSVELTYDQDGDRTAVALGRAAVRSAASLAYEHAEALLSKGTDPPADRYQGDVASLQTALEAMADLATALRERRRQAGSLFVVRPEREFEFRADGHVGALRERPLLQSHWIIEEFMLEANRAVAEVLHAARFPLLWRVHEDPDPDKVDQLADLLYDLGIPWRPADPLTGHDYDQLFGMVQGRPEERLIHLLALRSLMKAQYRAGHSGHFGLAFASYTHFTSPIRRFPDLHNQRCLHHLLDRRAEDGAWLPDALGAARQTSKEDRPTWIDRRGLEELADLCSRLERTAVQIERDAVDICAADFLKPREGEEVEGMIVSLVGSGFFVELEGMGIDGFVGVEQLGGDWYTLDRRRHAFVGERSGRAFGLGHRVRVLLEHVDVQNGRVWLGSVRRLDSRHHT